jgi:HSP20 family protein
MRTIPVSTWNRTLPLTRALDEMLGGNRLMGFLDDQEKPLTWIPPVDIWETADSYELYLDLPGVRADHIEILFDRGALTVAGTRERGWSPNKDETHRVHTAERFEGRFSRSFRLPQHVDADRIEASFNDGVLVVRASKAQSALPRRIKVNGTVGSEIGPAGNGSGSDI